MKNYFMIAITYKKLLPLLLLLIGMLNMGFTSKTTSSSDILGYWYYKKVTMKIYKAKDGRYYGKIVDLVNKDNLRKLTPETALILRKFKYVGDNKWKDGTVYVTSALIKGHLPGSIKMDDKDNIKMTACKGFACKTVIWNRVSGKGY